MSDNKFGGESNEIGGKKLSQDDILKASEYINSKFGEESISANKYLKDLQDAMDSDGSGFVTGMVPTSIGDIDGVKLKDNGNDGVSMEMRMTKEDAIEMYKEWSKPLFPDKDPKELIMHDLYSEQCLSGTKIPDEVVEHYKKCKEKGMNVAVIGMSAVGVAAVILGNMMARGSGQAQVIAVLPDVSTDSLSKLLQDNGYNVSINGEIPKHGISKIEILAEALKAEPRVYDLGDKPQKSKYARGNRKYDKKKFF